MTIDTPASVRHLVIYEVFVRNHGSHGTFVDVEADLPRIRDLGVDVVWLMPIHPIGVVDRKGTLGSPYAIRDYREVNPEYGTKADFERLVERTHALGMRVMIDVVYNHTAPDSRLVAEHPEFFHQDAAGRPMTTVPEWSDVIDFRYGDPALEEELVSTLEGWVRLGVDGFRCDVASLVPVDFWLRARARVRAINPDVLWLAESVHADWVADRRANGLSGVSDSELYAAAFDLTYDYDIWPLFLAAVHGQVPLERYLEAVRFQDAIYPATYAKMRCVENHDNRRIMALAPDPAAARGWTALAAFLRGPLLLYAGQESAATRTPSLFDLDPVAWGDYALSPFLARLAALKKHPAQVAGRLVFAAGEPVVQAAWEHPADGLYGVFNVRGAGGRVPVRLPDGDYTDLVRGGTVEVRGGTLDIPADAIVLAAGPLAEVPRLFSPLLDFGFDLG